MGEVLGIGTTHYPPLIVGPEHYANSIKRALKSSVVPEEMKDPKTWPADMQNEWANELELAKIHEEQLISNMRKVRKIIDDFNPDAVIIWGDDQYENFKEDLIPPFNIQCSDEFYSRPLHFPKNVWDEPRDKLFTYKGAGQLAKHIASELMDRDFPVPYSYKPLHFEGGLPHAFANTLIFLDWDRQGWPYPVIPMSVNCYGPDVISSRGGMGHLNPPTQKDPYMDYRGPGGPSPRSCFRFGQLVREIVDERPERVVLMGSSSWAHGFLNSKDHYLHPDRDFDRRLFNQLKIGEQRRWADVTNEEFDEVGGSEFKNWICLAGAMQMRTPEILDFIETWIFNSARCFAVFWPEGAAREASEANHQAAAR